MIQIGDKVTFVPAGFNGETKAVDPITGKTLPRKVTARVVWIHPEGRFYLTEYECFGHTLRECFKMR